MKYLAGICLLVINYSLAIAGPMTQDELQKIISDHSEVHEQNNGHVMFTYNKVRMAMLSNLKYDRMRIIAPIIEYSKVTSEQKDIIMEANFHKALDARYATSNDILYAAYIHPLSPLSKEEIIEAMKQVSMLAQSFGSTYSSGTLSFAGN